MNFNHGKLGRVIRHATPLYLQVRGGQKVPAPFWRPGSADGTLGGGVEFALLGASADREGAVKAASASDAQTLVQIEQGAVDRGADLSWLSQVCNGYGAPPMETPL